METTSWVAKETPVAWQHPLGCVTWLEGLTSLAPTRLTQTQTRREKGRRSRDWLQGVCSTCSRVFAYGALPNINRIISSRVHYGGRVGSKGFLLSLSFLFILWIIEGFSCVIVRPRDSQSSFTDTEWSTPSIKCTSSPFFYIYIFIYLFILAFFQRLVPIYVDTIYSIDLGRRRDCSAPCHAVSLPSFFSLDSRINRRDRNGCDACRVFSREWVCAEMWRERISWYFDHLTTAAEER